MHWRDKEPHEVMPIKCCMEKFIGQGDAYFDKKEYFDSYDEFIVTIDSLDEETFVMVYDEQKNFPPIVDVENCFLVECLKYKEHDLMNLVVIKRKDSHVVLNTVGSMQDKIDGISILVNCTDDDIYKPFLIEHFTKYHNEFDIKFDLNVIFYGNDELKEIRDFTNIIRFDEEFDNFFRVDKVSHCKYDHILLQDVDLYHQSYVIKDLINRYNNMESFGIFNLKHYITMAGNGQYLGRKDIIQNCLGGPLYGMWFKDTEFLMNLPRNGYIPTVFFVPFERQNHPRKSQYKSNAEIGRINKAGFEVILKHGREGYDKEYKK